MVPSGIDLLLVQLYKVGLKKVAYIYMHDLGHNMAGAMLLYRKKTERKLSKFHMLFHIFYLSLSS
jgi:hypothetical protein